MPLFSGHSSGRRFDSGINSREIRLPRDSTVLLLVFVGDLVFTGLPGAGFSHHGIRRDFFMRGWATAGFVAILFTPKALAAWVGECRCACLKNGHKTVGQALTCITSDFQGAAFRGIRKYKTREPRNNIFTYVLLADSHEWLRAAETPGPNTFRLVGGRLFGSWFFSRSVWPSVVCYLIFFKRLSISRHAPPHGFVAPKMFSRVQM